MVASSTKVCMMHALPTYPGKVVVGPAPAATPAAQRLLTGRTEWDTQVPGMGRAQPTLLSPVASRRMGLHLGTHTHGCLARAPKLHVGHIHPTHPKRPDFPLPCSRTQCMLSP